MVLKNQIWAQFSLKSIENSVLQIFWQLEMQEQELAAPELYKGEAQSVVTKYRFSQGKQAYQAYAGLSHDCPMDRKVCL